MAQKRGKKGAATRAAAAEPVAAPVNTTSVYDAAVDEIKSLGSDGARRKVESGPLREGRGQDVVRLHTTLKAIDAAHQSLASQVTALHGEVASDFSKTWNAVETSFEKTWDAARKDTAKVVDVAEKGFESTIDTAEKGFDKTIDTVEKGFQKTLDTVQNRFEKTWETVGTNFEATNERTTREMHDLREELTRVLDKRFTHIDQTFASIRADIEVLKALQMELIKERIGRPELVKR